MDENLGVVTLIRVHEQLLGGWQNVFTMTKKDGCCDLNLELIPKVRHDKGSGLGECSRLYHILTIVGGWISNIPKWFFILGVGSFMMSKFLGQGLREKNFI